MQEYYYKAKNNFWILDFSRFLHLVNEELGEHHKVNEETLHEVESTTQNSNISTTSENGIKSLNNQLSYSSYRVIPETTFLSRLSSTLSYFNQIEGFLSSKYFVETVLANEGFDIRSSWELFTKLKDQGKIIEYSYESKNGYPPLSAVRLP